MRNNFKSKHHNKSGSKTNYYRPQTPKDMARSLGKGKTISHKYPGVRVKEGDVKYLDSWKRKYTKDDLIFVKHGKFYRPVWLEEGNQKKGLRHIRYYGGSEGNGHEKNFYDAFKVDGNHIPKLLKNVIKKDNTTNIRRRDLNKDGITDGYDLFYEYKSKKLVIGIGTNGYIITAYPTKDKKTKRRKKKK